MPNDKPKKDDGLEEDTVKPKAPDLGMDSVPSEDVKKVNEVSSTKKSRREDLSQNKNGDTKKGETKKADKTIEKLKSKPPEKVREEIIKDLKFRVIKYKALSVIVSTILFLSLFTAAVAASYYTNYYLPPETDYRPEAEITVPQSLPDQENEEISVSTDSAEVQGVSATVSTCISENQNILSEVIQCEELNENSCLEYVDQFDYCMSSCLNVLDETQCGDICRPVCEDEITEEL